MRVRPAPGLPEVLLVETDIHADARGRFLETWRRDRYREAGIGGEFVQDNLSVSRAGVLRGLHFQHPHGQGKLVAALTGRVYDVAVDVRQGSPTLGRWHGTWLDGEAGRQVFVPPGFAHGFLVASGPAWVIYKCTDRYAPQAEHTLLWNDPGVGVEWPAGTDPLLSDKDAAGLTLRQHQERGTLPPYRP